MRTRSLLSALLIASLAALAGCGPTKVSPTGKLMKGGQNYAPPAGQLLTVTFIEQAEKDQAGASKASSDSVPYPAEVDQAAGTFRVKGPDGRGIPAGRYRIAVSQRMTNEAFEAVKTKLPRGTPRDADTLGDALSPDKTPIVREVTKSEEMVIDLDKEIPDKGGPPKGVPSS